LRTRHRGRAANQPRLGKRRILERLNQVDNPKSQENSSEFSALDSPPPSALEALVAERDQLAAEKAELQDRLLRARAEFDNARRRAERERSDFLQFAATDLVREI